MKGKPYLYALGASLLWGSSASAAKLLLKNLSSLQVLLFTSLIASITLFCIVCAQKKLPIVRSYKASDYFRFAYMSFIGVFIYYVCLYLALSYLSAQEAFIINYLWPIMIVLFAVPILGEKLTTRKIMAVILSFMGVAIIATAGSFRSVHFASLLGVILAIVAAVSYGLFSVLGKKHDYDKASSMMFYYMFTFFYVIIGVSIFSFIPHVTLPELGGFLWIGILSQGTAFLLWFLALKYGDTAKISNMAFLTPFISLVYIYFLLHEKILVSSLVGLCLIVCGILIQNRKPTAVTK